MLGPHLPGQRELHGGAVLALNTKAHASYDTNPPNIASQRDIAKGAAPTLRMGQLSLTHLRDHGL